MRSRRVLQSITQMTITAAVASLLIQAFECNAVLSAFKAASQFRSGAVFGTWTQGAASTYSAKLWFTRFNADGTVAGTQKVERAFTPAGDGNRFSGKLTLQILNPAGAVVAQDCGVEVACRVTW
jgi:hypothetical protein